MILGALLGSFLNVVIYRIPLGRSIVTPPSACTNCNTPLHWSLNIPVFSYLFLGGKCRYCGAPYSIRYAALEATTGFFFLACHYQFGITNLLFWKNVVLFLLCLAVFFIDFDHWIIPDSINLFGTVVGLLFSLAIPLKGPDFLRPILSSVLYHNTWYSSLLWSVTGALTGLAFFWAIQLIGLLIAKQEAMGGGDVKFAALIGAFLGPQAAIWAFFGSFILGAMIAVPMLLINRGGGKDPIPFGTFMAIATVSVSYWSTEPLLELLEGLRL